MNTFRIEIDRSLCSGFGSCIDLAPDLIALDASRIAALRVGETADPVVLEAAESCPMGTIAVFELASEAQVA